MNVNAQSRRVLRGDIRERRRADEIDIDRMTYDEDGAAQIPT